MLAVSQIMQTLTLPRELFEEMIERLQEAYPLEACGLLAGLEGTAHRLYAVENRLSSPVAYEMDPVQQLQALLDLEEAGLQLLAIYHSHPTGPQTPSPTDIALAYYPGVAHIIVSLRELQAPVARAFMIEEGRFDEVTLEIV